MLVMHLTLLSGQHPAMLHIIQLPSYLKFPGQIRCGDARLYRKHVQPQMCSTFKVLLLLLLRCRRVATTHDLVHERNLCGPVPAPYRRVVPQCTCQSLTQSINAIDVGQTSEEGLGALLSSFVEGCQYAQNDLILRLRNEAIITHLGYGRHGKYFPLLCTRQVEGIWIPKYGSMAAQRFCPASSFC